MLLQLLNHYIIKRRLSTLRTVQHLNNNNQLCSPKILIIVISLILAFSQMLRQVLVVHKRPVVIFINNHKQLSLKNVYNQLHIRYENLFHNHLLFVNIFIGHVLYFENILVLVRFQLSPNNLHLVGDYNYNNKKNNNMGRGEQQFKKRYPIG